MSEIKGFRGWRYNKARVKEHAHVLAPPYDVISKKDQERFHQKNPYNVIRLILGREQKGDSSTRNKYTRAAGFLRNWTGSGILTQDEVPSIYVYLQDYQEAGRVKSRLGFIAAMRLDEKAVLRHENTLASPKKDRMALLKEVRTNLSPIFGLFEDKKGGVQKLLKETLKRKPSIDVRIDGVRHRLFVENRPAQVRKLCARMRPKPMFIADGHHRFEVACQFKNWMRSQFPDAREAGWEYVMTYFSDCVNNPFTIYPTHRLITVPKGMKNPLETLRQRGALKKVSGLSVILSRLSKTRREALDKGYTFGVFTRKEGFFIFTLNKRLSARVKKNPVDRLDVAVLHKMLVEPCFKIKMTEKSPPQSSAGPSQKSRRDLRTGPPRFLADKSIDFTRDAQEACLKVKSGDFDMALFLRPTSLDEMLLASKKGLKMPQKSTYFYPKLLSGLVFHKFDN